MNLADFVPLSSMLTILQVKFLAPGCQQEVAIKMPELKSDQQINSCLMGTLKQTAESSSSYFIYESIVTDNCQQNENRQPKNLMTIRAGCL